MLHVVARHHENADISWPITALVCFLTKKVSLEGPFNGVTRQKKWQLRRHARLKMRSTTLRHPYALPAAHCSQYLLIPTHADVRAASSSSPVV